jgi:hypothetical protein
MAPRSASLGLETRSVEMPAIGSSAGGVEEDIIFEKTAKTV